MLFAAVARKLASPVLLARSSGIRGALAFSLATTWASSSPLSSKSLFFVSPSQLRPAAVPTHIFSSFSTSRSCPLSRRPVFAPPSRVFGTMSTPGPAAVPPKFSVAACQILCGEDKFANIASAEKAIKDAAATGAEVVILPECWNSPYDTASFPVYAEPVPEPRDSAAVPPSAEKSPSTSMLCRAAAENKVYVVGGSVPEAGEEGRFYNTCIVAGPDGRILGKHRKVHLFDIDVPGGITFKESDTLSPGNSITTVETPFGKIGVGICYDIRFPELSMAMRAAGCVLLCFPGAFNMTTGPAHWELLQRARALDNQCYVVTASPARNPDSKYQAWGHSSIVDPWGTVIATTEHESAMVVAEVDVGRVEEIRKGIPVSLQKRDDLYRLELS